MAENSEEIQGQVYIIGGVAMPYDQMVAYREEREKEKARGEVAYDEMLAQEARDRAARREAESKSEQI